MKKILLFLITILCSLNGWATEYTSGNLKYETEDHDEITYVIVKGLADGENPSSIEIPEQITRKISFQGISTTKTYKVYGVWSSAFKGNTNITSVTFPESENFKYINASAFEGCTGLTSITIPSGIGQISGSNDKGLHKNAFARCTNLKTVTINSQDLMTSSDKDNGVGDAFLYATTINMGDNVTSIGAYSFYRGNSDLKLVNFDFNNVTSIGSNAFENANKLTNVNLKNVETIGTNAFKGCTFQQVRFSKLTSDAGLPASVETYYIDELQPNSTFSSTNKETYLGSGSSYESKLKISNTNVKKLVFGPYVENIWNGILVNSSTRGTLQIEEIVCEHDGVGIGYFAFEKLTSLRTFTGKPGYIHMSSFKDCTSLASVDLSLCTDINKNAFYNCSNLTIDKNLGNVTNISDNAFFNCGKITAINSDKLTRIGQTAFKGCSMLTNVIAPNAYIVNGAFENCTSLKRADVKSFDSNSFNGTALKRLLINDNSLTSSDYTSSSNIGTRIGVSVDTLEFGDNVKTIGKYAFYQSSVGHIIFNNVQTIGDYAFTNCKSLVKFFPNSSSTTYAFKNCEKITSIGDHAFYGCENLGYVRFGNLTSLGDDAFNSCTSLEEAYLGNITEIPNRAFYGDINLENSSAEKATVIGEQAFEGCTKFAPSGSITNDNVVEIKKNAFKGCTSFEYAPVRYSSSIGDFAFYGCTNLIVPRLTETITIGESAFENCTNLSSLSGKIGTGDFVKVESIGKNAFKGTNITGVEFPNTLETLGTGAFPTVYEVNLNCPELLKKNYSQTDNLLNCFGFANGGGNGYIEIGDNVTEIGEYAFYNNTYTSRGAMDVEHIRIGDGVTTLGYRAFYGLNATNYIYIGKALKVDHNSYYGLEKTTCDNKVTIMIPADNSSWFEKNKNWHTIFGTKVKEYELGVEYASGYTLPKFALYTEVETALERITFNINPENDNPNIIILDDAVSGNKNLEYIDLSNVWIISDRAFKGCTSLKSVTIGSDNKDKLAGNLSLGENAFNGCTGLSSIEIKASRPNLIYVDGRTSINATAFTGVKPFIMIDMSDKATLPSVNAGETIFITNQEARAKELRAEKIGGVRKYKYVTSVQRMGCEPEDVNMDGYPDGKDAQAIYDYRSK